MSTTPKEIADICATGKEAVLFMEQSFAEPPEWFNFLPVPGTYNSPNYGQIAITPERNANFVSNFKAKVYQDKLPIDCEHDISSSGAVGWIVDMRVNSDGSVDAKSEWNDRGNELIKKDRFKYFSPAFFDLWHDPVNPDKAIRDVASGGALTTRPFFKEKSLRPLVANERGLAEGEVQNVKGESVVVLNFSVLPRQGVNMTEPINEPKQFTEKEFTELQTKLSEAEAALKTAQEEAAAKEAELTASKEQETKLSERVDALEKDARLKKFSELAKDWPGATEKHIGILEALGEGSQLFKDYVENQNAAAVQGKSLFSEIGSEAPPANSARAIMAAKVKSFREADPKLSEEQAFDKAWEEAPIQLREEFRAEESRTN